MQFLVLLVSGSNPSWVDFSVLWIYLSLNVLLFEIGG